MKLLAVAAMAGCAVAQTPDIDDIMSRVAINQAKALEMRTQFVYTQKQLLRMVRSNGKRSHCSSTVLRQTNCTL